MNDRSLRDAIWAARLALKSLDGVALSAETGCDWDALLETCARERVLPLSWIRNRSLILTQAPPTTSAQWRGRTLAAGVVAREQLEALDLAIRSVEAVGARPIVLKGLPLAYGLYGDIAARPVNDADLFIAEAERARAHDALVEAGFRHLFGQPPAEGTYSRVDGGRTFFLEVHSSVFDEELLAHLAAPAPESVSIEVDGVALRAQTGPLLPVFLSAHLAKHAEAPLLWWADFRTLWKSYRADERDEARRLARHWRLDRFLAWGERGVELLGRVVDGSIADASEALAELSAMHREHPRHRVASLSSTLRDQALSRVAWAWPRALRRRPLLYGRYLIDRVARQIAGAAHLERAPDVRAATSRELRGLAVSDDELLELVRDVAGAGATLWIRARGSSMSPTIKNGALVRVGPLPQRPLRRGDVVLAEMEGGKAVIHRVWRASGEAVVLKGDNMLYADAPLSRQAVLAIVEVVQQDTRARAIGSRPVLSPRRLLSHLRARLRVRVAARAS